jgi:hypothetical protein
MAPAASRHAGRRKLEPPAARTISRLLIRRVQIHGGNYLGKILIQAFLVYNVVKHRSFFTGLLP